MKTKNTKTAAEIKEVRDFIRERAYETRCSYRVDSAAHFNKLDCLWEIMMCIETYESCGLSAEKIISLLKEQMTFSVDFYESLEREEMKK